MSNLPAEIKQQLALLPEADIKRLEGMVLRGVTAPLIPEKESGPFLLFMIGESLEDVATKTGIPKDIIYLTYMKYGWEQKKQSLTRNGLADLTESLQKDMTMHILIATHKVVTDQVGKVLSGELPPEKCTFIPRSLHGVQQMIEMASKVNNVVNEADKKGGTTNITGQNIQINQSVEAPKEDVKRIPKAERLAQLTAQAEKK